MHLAAAKRAASDPAAAKALVEMGTMCGNMCVICRCGRGRRR